MHFPFNCFKPAPCAFHFMEIFYFVEIFCKNETIKSKSDRNIKKLAQSSNTSSKSEIETLEEGGNMFKVNNKDTRTTSLTSF